MSLTSSATPGAERKIKMDCERIDSYQRELRDCYDDYKNNLNTLDGYFYNMKDCWYDSASEKFFEKLEIIRTDLQEIGTQMKDMQTYLFGISNGMRALDDAAKSKNITIK